MVTTIRNCVNPKHTLIMKRNDLNEKEMHYFDNYNWREFLVKLDGNMTSLLHDKSLLTFGLAASGFVQVFLLNSDIVVDLLLGCVIGLATMSLMGYIKHLKTGEKNPDIFLEKTLVQIGLLVVVVALGVIGTILTNTLSRMAGVFMKENPIPPSASLYFIYSARVLMITYYFDKTVGLANEVAPDLLPGWFSAVIRRYRKTGKMRDLLPKNDLDPTDKSETNQ